MEEVKEICDAIKYQVASVCILLCKESREYVKDQMAICTVIGFRIGIIARKLRCLKPEAISEGADEIDMVINLGLVKDKEYEKNYEIR